MQIMIAWFFLVSLWAAPLMAEPILAAADLTEVSIEQLMDLEVSTVTKRRQKLSETAAAVFVLSGDDIRRSGAVSIPEALRLVPGLQVVRIDSHRWTVSSRGFYNEGYANKMLVLIDGRSVYSNISQTVFWEGQDTLLEDIDRIEVIRGPGTSLWGENAVNGVINIVTRNANDTQGALIAGGGGVQEQAIGNGRFGGKVGEDFAYRGFVKYYRRDDFTNTAGTNFQDGNDRIQGGVRTDWSLGEDDRLTLQGDIFDADGGGLFTYPDLNAPFSTVANRPQHMSGGNGLGRWSHTFSETSELELQAYYDQEKLQDVGTFNGIRHTVDLDSHHSFQLGERHQILWGGGYRLLWDKLKDVGIFFVATPPNQTTHHFGLFVQDDITLVPDRFHLIAGTKLSRNSYTDFEVEPTGRLLWTPTGRQTVWAAFSRSVRTPGRVEDGTRSNFMVTPPSTATGGLPVLVGAAGSPNFKPETALTGELGYRTEVTEQVSLDLTAFLARYNDIRTFETGTAALETTPAPAHLFLPLDLANMMNGTTAGAELATQWRPLDWWRISAAYSFLHMDFSLDPGSTDTTSVATAEGDGPKNQVNIHPSFDLPYHFEFDPIFYYVGPLKGRNIPHYFRLDARVGWVPTDRIELSAVAQNLTDDKHQEFSGTFTGATLVPRTFYGKATLRF